MLVLSSRTKKNKTKSLSIESISDPFTPLQKHSYNSVEFTMLKTNFATICKIFLFTKPCRLQTLDLTIY